MISFSKALWNGGGKPPLAVGFSDLFCGDLLPDTPLQIHTLVQKSGNLNEILINSPLEDNVLASLNPK